MRAKKVAVMLGGVVVAALLSGCAVQAGAASSTPAASTPSTASFAPVATTRAGTGSTIGAKIGNQPLDLTVATPTGTRGLEVKVTCPGSDEWFVSSQNSPEQRRGTCSQETAVLLPIAQPASSSSIDVLAFTGGKPFTVKAIATQKVFQQDAGLAAFCAAYETAESTVVNADLSYTKHLSSAAQWQASRATAVSQFEKVAGVAGSPAWAVKAAQAIRGAVLTAPVGTASHVAAAESDAVSLGCTNNSSGLTIAVTVPGEG